MSSNTGPKDHGAAESSTGGGIDPDSRAETVRHGPAQQTQGYGSTIPIPETQLLFH